MALLDGKPVNAKFGDENFDDLATSAWGVFDTNTVYVDNTLSVSTINSKGYQKYCKESNILNGNNSASTNWYKEGTSYLSNWVITNSCSYGICGDTVRCDVVANGTTVFTFGSLFSCYMPSDLGSLSGIIVNQNGGFCCRGFNASSSYSTATCSVSGGDVWYK